MHARTHSLQPGKDDRLLQRLFWISAAATFFSNLLKQNWHFGLITPPPQCTFVVTATVLAPPKFYRNYRDWPCATCLKDLPMRTSRDLLDTAVKSELWWLRLMLQLNDCCPLGEQSHILHRWMHMKNSTSFDVDLISLKVNFVALNLKVALGLVP